MFAAFLGRMAAGEDGSSASVWLRLEFLVTRMFVPRFVGFLAEVVQRKMEWQLRILEELQANLSSCAKISVPSLLLIESIVLAACTSDNKKLLCLL